MTLEFLRSFRIGEYAIFDLSTAFIGVLILSPLLSRIFLKFRIKIPILNWVFLTLPIGIATHLVIGRMTNMTRYFIDPSGHYLLKIIILALLILGLRGIKFVKKANISG